MPSYLECERRWSREGGGYVESWRAVEKDGHGLERLVLRGPAMGGYLHYPSPFPPASEVRYFDARVKFDPGQIVIHEEREVIHYRPRPYGPRTAFTIPWGEYGPLRLVMDPVPHVVSSDYRSWVLPRREEDTGPEDDEPWKDIPAHRIVDQAGNGVETLVLRGPADGGVLSRPEPFPPPRDVLYFDAWVRVPTGQTAIYERRKIIEYEPDVSSSTFLLLDLSADPDDPSYEGPEKLRLETGRLVARDGRSWILPTQEATTP